MCNTHSPERFRNNLDFSLQTIKNSAMAYIFLVEDNENLREALASYLKLDDHELYEFDRIRGVMDAIKVKRPDLIVLDVMLPDGSGFQLARIIKREEDIPILFLTAKSSESDRIAGFEVGGDDYVVKPFSPKEVSLRVKAILKRSRKDIPLKRGSEEWELDDHNLYIDSPAHQASVDGRKIDLTAAEWNILLYLSDNPGRVVERERLLGECLDYMVEGSERTIDTHIKNLRAKLGNAAWIETVRGFGYRFAGKVK